MDEIQYGRGHQYLTLVYPLDAGCQRLLWVGKQRCPNALNSLDRFHIVAKMNLVRSDPRRTASRGRPADVGV